MPSSRNFSTTKILTLHGLRAGMLSMLFFSVTASFSFALPSPKKAKSDSTSATLDEYLKRARAINLPAPTTMGSLWVSSSPWAMLATDYKAHGPGDVIVIRLTDNFSAATNGENKQSRQFNTNSAITGLLGQIGPKSRLQNLFDANSSTSLDGKGQSTLSSNVQLSLAGQVIEALPNGVLVVQAARDITVGNDRQTVILRGLVRPGDVAPDNSVVSTKISDLEVEIKGKGAVADITRQPNIVIRILLRLFSF